MTLVSLAFFVDAYVGFPDGVDADIGPDPTWVAGHIQDFYILSEALRA